MVFVESEKLKTDWGTSINENKHRRQESSVICQTYERLEKRARRGAGIWSLKRLGGRKVYDMCRGSWILPYIVCVQ